MNFSPIHRVFTGPHMLCCRKKINVLNKFIPLPLSNYSFLPHYFFVQPGYNVMHMPGWLDSRLSVCEPMRFAVFLGVFKLGESFVCLYDKCAIILGKLF